MAFKVFYTFFVGRFWGLVAVFNLKIKFFFIGGYLWMGIANFCFIQKNYLNKLGVLEICVLD